MVQSNLKAYESEVTQYTENGLDEALLIESVTAHEERSIAKDLIQQEAYDLQSDYKVSDKDRDTIMTRIYNRMFNTDYDYAVQIWPNKSYNKSGVFKDGKLVLPKDRPELQR